MQARTNLAVNDPFVGHDPYAGVRANGFEAVEIPKQQPRVTSMHPYPDKVFKLSSEIVAGIGMLRRRTSIASVPPMGGAFVSSGEIRIRVINYTKYPAIGPSIVNQGKNALKAGKWVGKGSRFVAGSGKAWTKNPSDDRSSIIKVIRYDYKGKPHHYENYFINNDEGLKIIDLPPGGQFSVSLTPYSQGVTSYEVDLPGYYALSNAQLKGK